MCNTYLPISQQLDDAPSLCFQIVTQFDRPKAVFFPRAYQTDKLLFQDTGKIFIRPADRLLYPDSLYLMVLCLQTEPAWRDPAVPVGQGHDLYGDVHAFPRM